MLVKLSIKTTPCWLTNANPNKLTKKIVLIEPCDQSDSNSKTYDNTISLKCTLRHTQECIFSDDDNHRILDEYVFIVSCNSLVKSKLVDNSKNVKLESLSLEHLKRLIIDFTVPLTLDSNSICNDDLPFKHYCMCSDSQIIAFIGMISNFIKKTSDTSKTDTLMNVKSKGYIPAYNNSILNLKQTLDDCFKD